MNRFIAGGLNTVADAMKKEAGGAFKPRSFRSSVRDATPTWVRAKLLGGNKHVGAHGGKSPFFPPPATTLPKSGPLKAPAAWMERHPHLTGAAGGALLTGYQQGTGQVDESVGLGGRAWHLGGNILGGAILGPKLMNRRFINKKPLQSIGMGAGMLATPRLVGLTDMSTKFIRKGQQALDENPNLVSDTFTSVRDAAADPSGVVTKGIEDYVEPKFEKWLEVPENNAYLEEKIEDTLKQLTGTVGEGVREALKDAVKHSPDVQKIMANPREELPKLLVESANKIIDQQAGDAKSSIMTGLREGGEKFMHELPTRLGGGALGGAGGYALGRLLSRATGNADNEELDYKERRKRERNRFLMGMLGTSAGAGLGAYAPEISKWVSSKFAEDASGDLYDVDAIIWAKEAAEPATAPPAFGQHVSRQTAPELREGISQNRNKLVDSYGRARQSREASMDRVVAHPGGVPTKPGFFASPRHERSYANQKNTYAAQDAVVPRVGWSPTHNIGEWLYKKIAPGYTGITGLNEANARRDRAYTRYQKTRDARETQDRKAFITEQDGLKGKIDTSVEQLRRGLHAPTDSWAKEAADNTNVGDIT